MADEKKPKISLGNMGIIPELFFDIIARAIPGFAFLSCFYAVLFYNNVYSNLSDLNKLQIHNPTFIFLISYLTGIILDNISALVFKCKKIKLPAFHEAIKSKSHHKIVKDGVMSFLNRTFGTIEHSIDRDKIGNDRIIGELLSEKIIKYIDNDRKDLCFQDDIENSGDLKKRLTGIKDKKLRKNILKIWNEKPYEYRIQSYRIRWLLISWIRIHYPDEGRRLKKYMAETVMLRSLILTSLLTIVLYIGRNIYDFYYLNDLAFSYRILYFFILVLILGVFLKGHSMHSDFFNMNIISLTHNIINKESIDNQATHSNA